MGTGIDIAPHHGSIAVYQDVAPAGRGLDGETLGLAIGDVSEAAESLPAQRPLTA
jgi:hypothetical protein